MSNFFEENQELIWGMVLVVLVAQFIELRYRQIFKKYYEKAEEARKLELVESVFSLNKDIDLQFLLDKVGEKVLNYANQNPKPPFDPDSYLDDRNSRMVEQIQANCFYTARYLRANAKKWWRWHVSYLVIIGVVIIACFYAIDTSNNSSDLKITFEISQIMGLIISTFVGLALWDNFQSCKKKSILLEELAKKLENEKHSTNEDEVILIFSEYNSIVSDAEPSPSNFWNRNKEKLTKMWKKGVFSKKNHPSV